MGPSRFRAPEILFRPDIVGAECGGVAENIGRSIEQADIDLRKMLWGSIVLCGGTSKMKGFGLRLIRELRNVAPRRTGVKVVSPTDPILCAWKGGSILSSIECFRRLWITQDDWAELGPDIVRQKIF